MRNINFLETGFTGQRDFNGVWYSTTNIRLPNKNRFAFQGKVVKVNCMRESMRNMSVPLFLCRNCILKAWLIAEYKISKILSQHPFCLIIL
jgi:hypothetical protein